jgi:uncharacterized membrane protein
MNLSYNEIAGRSPERLGALSDGVFAFAMTLLVLDLRVPAVALVHSEHALLWALSGLAPNLLTYFSSFMVLGIFWVGQQTQVNKLKHSDRELTWIHLAFLLAVTFVPFSTQLLAAFIVYRTALILYWLNILALGAVLYWSWGHARGANLIRDDAPPALDAAVRGRILVAQALYAVGALLCIFSTYASIGFIVLVQLNYAIAPRIGVLRKI